MREGSTSVFPSRRRLHSSRPPSSLKRNSSLPSGDLTTSTAQPHSVAAQATISILFFIRKLYHIDSLLAKVAGGGTALAPDIVEFVKGNPPPPLTEKQTIALEKYLLKAEGK